MKNKGITLIALSVTIIIIIILSSVIISMLTGENGILNKAFESKNKTRVAQTEELIKLGITETLIEGKGRILNTESLIKAFDGTIGSGKYNLTGENGEWTIKVGEKIYDIDGDGNFTKSLPNTAEGQPAGTEIKNPYGPNSNAKAIADGKGKYFALPKGENVSYDTSTNVDEGAVVTINGSEFVWVPVDDVVIDKTNVEKMAQLPTSSLVQTTKDTYTPMAVQDGENYKGILYNYSEGNCYLLYPDNPDYQGKPSLNKGQEGPIPGYREPAVVINYDGGSLDMVGITLSNLQREYNKMIKQVEKYKGFYIARYEAGLENGKIVFKNAGENSSVTTLDASNDASKGWYGLYSKMKEFKIDSIESTMIWGSQYDAMLNWMSKNGKNVTVAKTNEETITGKNKNDIINNVYDLYRCHYEWTIEAYSSDSRTLRGGPYGNKSSPANRSYYSSNITNNNSSSRSTLYIK